MADMNLERGSLLDVVIGIMLTMGIFGGIVNFQLTAKKDSDVSLKKSVSAGIAAAILIPLFLNMIGSNLLNSSKVTYSNLLVLAGFCLIAAISSRAFMNSLSERLLQQMEQVSKKVDERAEKMEQVSKEVKEQAEKVEELYTEPEIPVATAAAESPHPVAPQPPALDQKALEVLRALDNSRFVVRTFSGIAMDTKLTSGEVEGHLRELEQLGLAQILQRPK